MVQLAAGSRVVCEAGESPVRECAAPVTGERRRAAEAAAAARFQQMPLADTGGHRTCRSASSAAATSAPSVCELPSQPPTLLASLS